MILQYLSVWIDLLPGDHLKETKGNIKVYAHFFVIAIFQPVRRKYFYFMLYFMRIRTMAMTVCSIEVNPFSFDIFNVSSNVDIALILKCI